MADNPEELIYLEPVPALEVSQGEGTFYLLAISAKKLLEIAYTPERTQYNKTGIQRGLRPDRLRDIGKFLASDGSNPHFFPTQLL